MRKSVDITNLKFGRLVVIGKGSKDKYGRTLWLCLCDCGNYSQVSFSDLNRGHTKSCGCWSIENSIISHTKHDKYGTRLYRIWAGMKTRCSNKNRKSYSDYGGRGITVCDEWKENFMAFYNWSIDSGYQDNLTIDRKDNNGNYCPENCRWATKDEQMKNTRRNRLITINNEIKTLTEWSKISGINFGTLYSRVQSGIHGEDLLKPVKQIKKNGGF